MVRALREQGFTLPVSVDTYDASVAHELVSLGASVVNDVSGGARDPAMLPTVARLGVPAALMHMRGDPSSMQSLASYDDVVGEVRAELGLRLDAARAAGVPRWSLLADPGIGFAKTAEHNLASARAQPSHVADTHRPHDAPTRPPCRHRVATATISLGGTPRLLGTV